MLALVPLLLTKRRPVSPNRTHAHGLTAPTLPFPLPPLRPAIPPPEPLPLCPRPTPLTPSPHSSSLLSPLLLPHPSACLAGRLEKAQEEIERLKAESAPDSATLTQVEHRLAALEEAHERTQEENRALRERARKLEREAEAARAEARARKEEAEEAKAGAARAVAEAEAARGRVKALEVAAAEAAEARKQSREALREMAEQNARLVAAFVSKKDEARRAREEAAEQRRHAEAREADASALLAARAAEIESLRCVVERLRAALRGVGEHEARASGDVAGHQEGGGEEGEGEATPLGERVGEEGGTSEGEGEGGAEEEAANTEERRRQRRALLEELGRAGGEGFRAQEEGLRTHEEGSGARGEPGAGPRAPLKRWQSSPAVGRGEGGRGGHGDGTPVSQRGAPGRGGDGDGDGGSADTPTSADTSLSPVRPGYRPRGESGGDVGVEEESASFGANAGLRGAGGDGDRAPMGTEPEAGTESSSWGGMPRRGKCQSETWSGGAWSGTEGGGSAEGTGRREEESCSAESARRGPAGGEEEAQRLKEAGNALFREGKYKEACARYTRCVRRCSCCLILRCLPSRRERVGWLGRDVTPWIFNVLPLSSLL